MAGVPFFVNPLPFTIGSETTPVTGKPAANLAEFQFSGMTWSSAVATPNISVDLGSPQTIDFVAVLNANAIPATNISFNLGATATEAAASPPFTSGVSSFISPAVSGRPLYNSHYQFATPQTYRWLNLAILNHTGLPFEAAFLVIGKKVQPSKYYEPEWDAGPVDLSTLAIGRNGVPDIAPGLVQRTIGFTLAWQTEAEFQTQMQPLANAAGKVNPVYLCFDPDPTTYRQDRTYFGRFTDSLKTTKKGWNRFTRSFAMQSMI